LIKILIEMDNTTILYSSIQRIYRSAMVSLIRGTLENSNLGGIEEIQRLFAKKDEASGQTQWQRIRSAAEERRSGGTGEISTPIRDEYELIGVEHLYNIFQVHFDLLCPAHAQKPKKEKNQACQALLASIKQIKNVRDPVSHPTTEDINYEDALNALYNARKVLDFCSLPEASSQILRLQRTLLGGFSDNSENILTELPPPDEVVMDFVGRHNELATLNTWLNQKSSQRWALSGEGGKGKSAIAYAFAKSISSRDDHGLDSVLWMSAKRRRFIEGSTVLVDRPDFYDKKTAIFAILSFFGVGQEDATEEKVFSLLTDFPSLLIIDDIDTVEAEGEDAIQFLVMTIPERTKSVILITSRRAIFGMANLTTQVTGLTPPDAEDFIKSRCAFMGISANPILSFKTQLLEVTDSSPLFLEDLLRLSQTGLSIEKAIGLWAKKRGIEARKYALQREYDQLDDDAKQILLALSVYGPSESDILCQGLDWSEERLLDALQQLRKMFLMPSQNLSSAKKGFTLGQNTQLLVRDVFSGTEAYRRMERSIKAAAGKLRTSSSEDKQVGSILKQARYLAHKQTEEAERIVEDATVSYPARSDLYATLAWIQKKSHNFASARMNFKRSHDLGACNADAYWHWSAMEASLKEWNTSAQAAELGIANYPDDQGLLFRLGYALQRQGKELILEEDSAAGLKALRRAKAYLDKALNHDNPVGRNYSLRYQIFRAMALTIESMSDWSALPSLFSRWESECPDDYAQETERLRLSTKCPDLINRRRK
jgi:tetratricopeptide (TPR) repeat protein